MIMSNKKKRSYKVIVFDFDGTLADSIELVRKVANELAETYHFKKIPAEEVDLLKSFDLGQFRKHLGIKRHLLPIVVAKGQLLFRRHLSDLELFPHMLEVLKELKEKGFKLGILTSNSGENVQNFLEHRQLADSFDFIYSGAKLGGKAHHIKVLLKRHNIKRKEMLYVGDEIRDVKASHRARVHVAAVSWGFNTKERLETLNPKFLLEQPSELLKVLI